MLLFAGHPRRFRRAFSFVEVLFAVIILGVGFIMVAAIFPVAIQQAKLTTEETASASVGRGAIAYISRVVSDAADPTAASARLKSNLPPTSKLGSALGVPGYVWRTPGLEATDTDTDTLVASATDTAPKSHLWSYINNNLILPEDPRSAYAVLYRRSGDRNQTATWSNTAQVYVFTLQSRNLPIFTSHDVKPVDSAGNPVAGVPNLQPHRVRFAVLHYVPAAAQAQAMGGVDLLVFDATPDNSEYYNSAVGNGLAGALVEGAYVVVENDQIIGADANRCNGMIFKLGVRRSDLDSVGLIGSNSNVTAQVVYECDPSNPMTPDIGADGILNTADDINALGVNNYAGSNVTFNTGTPANGLATGFVVGRGYADPNYGYPNANSRYEGGCMVTGVYTTFIKLN